MAKRMSITLSENAAALLQSLAEDCNLPQSMIVEQLIKRYHSQLRQLLVIDCNLVQPTATQAHQSAPIQQPLTQSEPIQPKTPSNGSKPSLPPRTPITGF